PNTGYMQIWLQRAIIKLDLEDDFFDENICKLVENSKIELWNNDWLNDDIKNIFNKNSIIDREKIDSLDEVISNDEVLLFGEQSL
ncbi:MAG: hypothetical protein LGB05_08170, partial [Sulfurovum sp.]|nr:hypothetical protein [Sulfurovum sp.]